MFACSLILWILHFQLKQERTEANCSMFYFIIKQRRTGHAASQSSTFVKMLNFDPAKVKRLTLIYCFIIMVYKVLLQCYDHMTCIWPITLVEVCALPVYLKTFLLK